jgi:hypothetical protein
METPRRHSRMCREDAEVCAESQRAVEADWVGLHKK